VLLTNAGESFKMPSAVSRRGSPAQATTVSNEKSGKLSQITDFRKVVVMLAGCLPNHKKEGAVKTVRR
jgi:hypothetical protein